MINYDYAIAEDNEEDNMIENIKKNIFGNGRGFVLIYLAIALVALLAVAGLPVCCQGRTSECGGLRRPGRSRMPVSGHFFSDSRLGRGRFECNFICHKKQSCQS
jgi:hypothetical protein